mmetsp:Transcript_36784/g.68108  ORF Transcript_36784/g.68108 Transcript_36784/m.68108 type:complete len:271 (+) Transcript_36784:2889-3701(+)
MVLSLPELLGGELRARSGHVGRCGTAERAPVRPVRIGRERQRKDAPDCPVRGHYRWADRSDRDVLLRRPNGDVVQNTRNEVRAQTTECRDLPRPAALRDGRSAFLHRRVGRGISPSIVVRRRQSQLLHCCPHSPRRPDAALPPGAFLPNRRPGGSRRSSPLHVRIGNLPTRRVGQKLRLPRRVQDGSTADAHGADGPSGQPGAPVEELGVRSPEMVAEAVPGGGRALHNRQARPGRPHDQRDGRDGEGGGRVVEDTQPQLLSVDAGRRWR